MERDVIARSKADSLCLVCGDKASGRHYGVPSCDGCRGFFKRSIRRNLDYVCKESNQCVVDVSRRNQCQACRFRRCLEMNMKREAVQHERAPRGSFKRVFPPEFSVVPPIPSTVPLVPANGSASLGHLYAGSLPFPWRPHLGAILQPPRHFNVNLLGPHFGSISLAAAVPTGQPDDLFTGPLKSAENTRHPPAVTDDEVSSSANEEPITITHSDQVKVDSSKTGGRNERPSVALPAGSPPVKVSLVRSFPADPALTSGDSAGQPSLTSSLAAATDREANVAGDLNESAARLLFLAVRWARAIPSFSQLTCHDQNLLLEETWCELFVLTIAQWNFSLDEGNLSRHCPNDRRQFWADGLQQLRHLVARILALRMDHTEYACLKALVLFKPEAGGLRDTLSVEVWQDQTQIMLHEYCANHVTGMAVMAIHQRHPSFPGRFGKLLLLLPSLRAVARDLIADVFFRQIIGDTPIGRLLVDLMAAV